VVVHTYNSSTWEDHRFKANLGYLVRLLSLTERERARGRERGSERERKRERERERERERT
jgi:hypothetical protein